MTADRHESLEVEFLGTGTSTGVPQIGCPCAVCQSVDPRDSRLRASAIVRYKGHSLLIDCGPDFRTQILKASSQQIDSLLITHIHYDHVGGIDDLRAYCGGGHEFPIFARADVIADLHTRLPYCFAEHLYPGVARLRITPVREWEPFEVHGIEVLPIPVQHYQLPILGYRIGPMAYITDAKTITDDVVDALHGVPLLVLNALRDKPHLSHMNLAEALEVVRRIEPQHTYLTHMSHDIGLHAVADDALPQGVHLAYDGLRVTV